MKTITEPLALAARPAERVELAGGMQYIPAVLAVLYAGVLTLWFATQPIPALQDLQEWVFQGWAALRLLQGDAAMRAQFTLARFPVPNLLSQWLLTLLSAVAGPFAAAKMLACGYCLGATAVCAAAARRFFPKAPVQAFVVLLSVAAMNACFWHGYMNYQIGLMVLLLYLERTHLRRPSTTMVLFFSLLLYVCHGSVLIAFLLLVTFREWDRPDRTRIIGALWPASLLFLAYVLTHAHRGRGDQPSGGLLKHLIYKCYTLAKAGPYHNLVDASGASAATSSPLLYHAGVLLNLAFAAVLVGAIVLGGVRWWGRREMPVWVLLFWGSLLLLFVAMPADMVEVVNLGERFMYVLLLSALLMIPAMPLRTAMVWMCVAGFALTAAQLPRASLPSMSAPEGFHRPSSADAASFRSDGLFSHRLYQNDERRTEMRDRVEQFTPLLFDTSALLQRNAVKNDAVKNEDKAR